MRLLLVIIFTLPSFMVFSQDATPHQKIFEGYIFSEDSIPAEYAYLINYRSSVVSRTNNKGYFKINIQDGDSLMINHVSLAPMVIHTSAVKQGIYTIYVPYRTYTLRTIHIGDYEKMRKTADENIEQAKRDLKQIIVVRPSTRALPDQNPYNDAKLNPGITVTLLKLNKPKTQEIPPE